MKDIAGLSQLIDTVIDSLRMHKELAIDHAKIPANDAGIFDTISSLYNTLNRAIKTKGELPENHLTNMNQHINNLYNALPYKEHKSIGAVIGQYPEEGRKERLAEHFVKILQNLNQRYNASQFNLNIFLQLDFFENNIVLVGANGSGKTTLANTLQKTFNQNNGIVISAQRVLRVSKYSNITSVAETKKKLDQIRGRGKTYKTLGEYGYLQDEFDTVMQNLVAGNVSAGLSYSNQSKVKVPDIPAAKTKLDRTIEIWNSLIGHIEIAFADDHINIVPLTKGGVAYELVQMSEGEKVMLYLIAQVLQAPDNGFIIVDEPEIFLHRAILGKLWNRLESERKDCIFVYLTHDIPFAASRDAQKVWIRSYESPNKWEFEAIRNEELPEELLLELLGSQKKVLFCEGDVGGDESMYNTLFPNFTIKAVGSCKNVIDYVRAFNRIPNRLANAIGIIDTDFRENTELEALKKDKVFSIKVAEIENLLFDEKFLELCASQLLHNKRAVDQIKAGVLKKFEEDIEMQVSHFVIAKINHLFNNSHVSRANNVSDVQNEYDKFIGQIDIQGWSKDRTRLVQEIVASKDYTEAIRHYNNKGLFSVANHCFGLTIFRQFAMKELKSNPEVHNLLRKYFPQEMLDAHES